MLSFEDVQLIQDIVAREDSKDFMDKLISFYGAQSSDNCQHLVELIARIVDQQIRFYSEQITDYRLAANWLINMKNMNKKDKHSYFAAMVPIIKTMYPEGLNNNESEARLKQFREFLELLNDPKVFSLDNEEDRYWACQFGYLRYLENMYNKYLKGDENNV